MDSFSVYKVIDGTQVDTQFEKGFLQIWYSVTQAISCASRSRVQTQMPTLQLRHSSARYCVK